MHIIPNETRYQCHIKALHTGLNLLYALIHEEGVHIWCASSLYIRFIEVVTGKTKKHAGIIDTNEFVTLLFRRKGNAVEALSVHTAWLPSSMYSNLWPVATSLLKTES